MSAKTDFKFVNNKDCSTSFVSKTLEITYPTHCVSFQGYSLGGVHGIVSLEVSIFADMWEPLQGCKPIQIDMNTNEKFFFIIPQSSCYAGKIRLRFDKEVGSTGTLNVAVRTMPL